MSAFFLMLQLDFKKKLLVSFFFSPLYSIISSFATARQVPRKAEQTDFHMLAMPASRLLRSCPS